MKTRHGFVDHPYQDPSLLPAAPAWPAGPYRKSATGSASPARRRAPTHRAFSGRELIAAVVLIAVADVALVGREAMVTGGLGVAVLLGLSPVALILAARAWRASRRLGVVGALLALVAARCAWLPSPAVVLSGLSLVVAFALTLRARVFVPEIAVSTLAAVAKVPSRLGAAARGARALGLRTRAGNVRLLPIVVPAGLVGAFLGLFALANPVVARGIGVAWSALSRVVAFPTVDRVAVWAFALAAGVCLLRPACRLPRGAEDATTNVAADATALLVARNALVGLNVLFFGYNLLDARYLWTGAPPEGMTTQQYAHQGALWLTVALVGLTAVIGVSFRGALAHDARARHIRSLAYAWTAQGVVLALGTYRRIAIHIAKSGLSDLRIVGVLGTSLVVCGVALVVWKLRHQKTFTWLLRRQLDTFAVVCVLYAVTPTHLLSARVNVARVSHGEYRPVLHAFRQSHETESAGELLPLLHHPDVRVRQGVAALLLAERDYLRAAVQARSSWRERDLATGRALAALEEASPRLVAELGSVSPSDAQRVLLELSRAANEDRSIEERFIPAARAHAAR